MCGIAIDCEILPDGLSNQRSGFGMEVLSGTAIRCNAGTFLIYKQKI